MTLEEAQARIHELEMENMALKGNRRPWRDAIPGARENGLHLQTTDYSAFLSYIRRALFGTVPRNKVIGFHNEKRTVVSPCAKKTIDLTDEEYAFYKEFCEKLFKLIRVTIDEWETRKERD